MFLSLLKYLRIWLDLFFLLKRSEKHIDFREKVRHALHGSLKPTDALLFRKILCSYRPMKILEVGSFLGVSSRWILEVSQEWSGHLTAIDPNIPHRVFVAPRDYMTHLNSRFLPTHLEIVTAFLGNYGGTCLTCSTGTERIGEPDFGKIKVIDGGWGRRFDLIFIDGEHSYEAVMNNFNICVRLLNRGGCIVFHDVLSREGVMNGLRDIARAYEGKAEVQILGERDRKMLNLIGRANDGIGLFRYI